MKINTHRTYPSTRLRRLRENDNIRKLVSETTVLVEELIYPIFVTDDSSRATEISNMPDIKRYTLESMNSHIDEAVRHGIKNIMLFPDISINKKDVHGTEALNELGLIPECLRKIKEKFSDITVYVDVALDPYTTHGHDGVIDSQNKVMNDETVEILGKKSIVLAKAGADVICPSDMMDGRIGAIRAELDKNGFKKVCIMSYAIKYASSFYGPFRSAVGSDKLLNSGNKNGYQMNPGNVSEALHEISLDISEGADMFIVKPGLPYLDIISKVSEKFSIPVIAYQVSGEYSMIKSAGSMKYIDEDKAIIESLICLKRAGSSGIITYFALKAAKLLQNKLNS